MAPSAASMSPPVAHRRQDVHHRRAEQPRDIDAGRAVIDLDRRADLADPAVLQDRHAVGDRHRLFLVMRDIDQRLAELALDALQLDAGLFAQPRIERRDRIVHQIGDGIAHQRARDRHALALAAGKLRRRLVQDVADVKLGRDIGEPRFDLGLRHLALDQRESGHCRARSYAETARGSGTPSRRCARPARRH